MAVPTVVFMAKGKGAGAVTPVTWGTVLANDILLALAETSNADTFDPTNTFNGTPVTNTPVTQGGTKLWAEWKRAAGGESAPVIADAGDHQAVVVLCIRGCPTTGDPFDATPTPSTDSTSDTSGSVTGYSTADVDRLVVFGLCGDLPDTNTTAQYGALTNGALTNQVEQADDSTNGGNGGSLGVITATKATAGAIGTSTYTKAASAVKAHIVIAFKPPPPTTDLVIADAAHAHVVDSIVLTQAHTLAVADGAHGHGVENAVLTQVHVLTVADATQAHSADNVVLQEQAGSTDLVISDGAHAHAADGLVLTQVHTLVIQDAGHSQATDNIAPTQVHTLAVAQAAQSQSVDAVALTQVHTLVIADASQAQAAEQCQVNSATQLAIADGLILTQVHQLLVAEAAQSHAVELLALTQVHELVAADALHAHTVDNVGLDASGAIPLVIQDAHHTQAVDGLILTHVLVPRVLAASNGLAGLHAYTTGQDDLTGWFTAATVLVASEA